MKKYHVLGMMSGSSMDGVDITFCRLEEDNGKWRFEIEKAECVPYPPKWRLRLQSLVLQNAVTYLKTDSFYGHYLGEVARKFIQENMLEEKVDFIASHGQTVFHQPENQMTSQIGDGAAISAETGLAVVCNFRTIDIALGGQGTPMAPIGDQLLFPEFKFFLNLGGIANLSCRLDNKMIGFDVCGANMVLNALAADIDLEFDKDGSIARSGNLNQDLLNELNTQWYYEKPYPKSIGGGWVTKIFLPVFKKYRLQIEDKLRTAAEHIAVQIGKDLKSIYATEYLTKDDTQSMLVTGGGTFNKFLLERINYHSPVEVVVPDPMTIKFKEGLLTGLMGVLRLRGEVNMLSSVTGASADSCGGEIYQSLNRKVEMA
ncbi:MAG: anhydro-N-acetylmuramic acid kinase [Chitinophagales bacterium]|nr:anhydro-N-acetylmuramic acid kinase [Chitinophagales bacterium]